MYGRVTKYFHDRGYGFIKGEDGNTYFIHHSNLKGEYIDPGYFVSFKPFQSDRSDYNAKNIVVIDAVERKRKYGNTRKKHERTIKSNATNTDKA